ncbi:hypothetical protein KEM48_001646 [Puccinia striiformis f. sp. tritici PST-130]|nr:hypothetical protein Pst134EB_001239 [Puccinia striiformis f. sp. tritici]KAI9607013.1 hypothetical protein KEM48_001646 [Puccinia striiformis f. sp. tritici PST-130]
MSSHHQKISNEEQDMSSSAIDITGDMSEELPIQSTDTTRSPRPKTKRAKSSIVVVIEDSFSTAFEFDCPDHVIEYDTDQALSPCSPTGSSSSSSSHKTEDSEDGLDHLDGLLLPDFFTYTSEERAMIRRNQPLLRLQLQKSCVDHHFSAQLPTSNSKDSINQHTTS